MAKSYLLVWVLSAFLSMLLSACGAKDLRFVANDGQPGAGAAIKFSGSNGTLEVPAFDGQPARSTQLSNIDYPQYSLFPPQGVLVSMTAQDDGKTMKFTVIDRQLFLQSSTLYHLPEKWHRVEP